MGALADVLAEMGVQDPAATAAEAERRLGLLGYGVLWDRERYHAVQRARYAESARAGKAAALAAAVPYAGSIGRCQAAVHEDGRSVGTRRCLKAALLVVRRKEGAGRGDGRLAVCRTHAEDARSYRSADEPVEPEYQP